MALPGFRKRPRPASSPNAGSIKDGPPQDGGINTKRATKTRRNAIIFTSFCYLVSVIFLILVEIGNTKGTRVLGDIYFYRLDLADILPTAISSPNLTLMNSIARTLGLHDFYQVGLWNFCEGYENEGVTYCSPTQNLYWFNPVEIVQGELLSGASIALPSEVNTILNILRIVSQIMFGFFITGAVLDFILMFLAPIVLYSRWWSLPFAILAFLAALLVTAATVLATAITLVFKYALTSQTDLNIGVDIGVKMWAFMWIATAFSLLAFIIHAGLGCCCTSRRDLRTGRKGGRKLAMANSPDSAETPKRGYKLPTFGRKSATSG
ncbi:SUR7/PalI family-domain-containing protein [Xylariales sp. AK1849]|nr:SUR7/PalI family-domain-containing protein [Xylariales sp. AK1849]